MSTATKINLRDVKSVSEAMEVSGLVYAAEPMEILLANGKSVDTHKAVVRSDNGAQLGIVGKDYSIVQSIHAFALGDFFKETKGAEFDSVVIIDGGRKVHLSMVVGEFEVKKGDPMREKITMINSFDGSSAQSTIFEVERLICLNGLRGWRKDSQISVRHSGDVESKLKAAYMISDYASEHFERFTITCKELTNKIADKKMVDAFIEEMVGDLKSTRSQNQAASITNLFNHGKGNNGESAWDLYNGYTEYMDHFNGSDDSKRLASVVSGAGSMKKMSAFEFLAKY